MKRSATSIAEAKIILEEPRRAEGREIPAGKNG
jgi:hypothetical protein